MPKHAATHAPGHAQTPAPKKAASGHHAQDDARGKRARAGQASDPRARDKAPREHRATVGKPGTGKALGAKHSGSTDFGLEELARVIERAGTPCPEHALAKLHTYVATLMRWNARMNLVGARSWQTAAEDLIADCVRLSSFLDSLPLPGAPLCWDPGAGAGLPGIPLRLLWQRGDYHMVEVREKRALFLSQMVASLELPRTHVHREDIAAFMAKSPSQADLVVSRAFLPCDRVLALVKDHLAKDGLVVFMANALPEEGLLESLGYAAAGALSYPCPAGTRHFWACRKVQAAPDRQRKG